MKTMIKLLIVLALFVVLTACGNSKTQTKKYFRISSNHVNVEKNMADTLVIKKPTALSILGGRPMVATQEDNSLVQLSNHFWLESPKVLLQDILKKWAQAHWQQVTTQVPQHQHHILNTRILAFEKVQDQALVKLEFNLYDADNKLLYSEQFSQQQTLPGDGYKAFAKAIGLAIDVILNQLSQQISHVIESTD